MDDCISRDNTAVYNNGVSNEINMEIGTPSAAEDEHVTRYSTDQANQHPADSNWIGKRKENVDHTKTESDAKKRKGTDPPVAELQPSAVMQHGSPSSEVEGKLSSSTEDEPPTSKEAQSSTAVEDDDDESTSKTENVCIACWKSFTSAAILSVHVRSHENVKLYPCYKCRKSFKTTMALFRHEQTSLHNSDVAFSCEICLAMFETKKYLNRHIVRMHKKNHCDVCSKRFCTESELESHDCERPKFPKYHCDGCIQIFPTEGRFVNHQNTTKCDREMLFKCGICCLAFDVKRAYLKHMHGHMGGDGKPYVCGTCNKGFDILANLELHMPRHKGCEALKCGVCDKRYEWAKKGYYKQHIHLHIGKTPYVCGICLKRYKNFSSVQNHLKVTHFSDRSCYEAN